MKLAQSNVVTQSTSAANLASLMKRELHPSEPARGMKRSQHAAKTKCKPVIYSSNFDFVGVAG